MIDAQAATARLLVDGPHRAGAESLRLHVDRVGPTPSLAPEEIACLVHGSGLTGRGGAGFPSGTKMRAVIARSRGDAVVAVNGAEGEPASHKDRALLTTRPHLVLDGAALAARAVRARDVVLYLPDTDRAVGRAVTAALEERGTRDGVRYHLVWAPPGYVSGEESAMVRRINGGPAKPSAVPPRPFERGVAGRPTLVHNVETLAQLALIVRHRPGWFADLGCEDAPGTALMTVWHRRAPRVVEVPLGTVLGEVASAGGVLITDSPAVLVGGYFGGFLQAPQAWSLRLSDADLGGVGARVGAGVLLILSPAVCGLAELSRAVTYLARESAGQCGPCVRGLDAVAQAVAMLVRGGSDAEPVLDRLRRWTGQIRGRGACHHPDGAVQLVASGLATFADEIARHTRGGPCDATPRRSELPGMPIVKLGRLEW